MLIDACRSDGAKNAGMGIGEEKQQGVITFFSCSPSQVSYEIDEIGQGAFTNVLLEALRIQGEGNCATVERFANYLKFCVPKLTQRYKNYPQTPYVVIEPETKLHYILLPKFANLTDITLLKIDALHAEAEGDFGLAFELWMRVNVAASGTDMQAVHAFQRLANKQSAPNSQLKERVSDRVLQGLFGAKVTPSNQQTNNQIAEQLAKIATAEKQANLERQHSEPFISPTNPSSNLVKAKLTAKATESPHKEFILDDNPLIVGKFDPDTGKVDINLINFPNSDLISRHHAELSFDGKNWQVTDLNTVNGTWLKRGTDRRFKKVIQTETLSEGDRLSFANILFTFSLIPEIS
jgi:pSer/pThr/pTyr-binding forkhead associated (FHA) protein